MVEEYRDEGGETRDGLMALSCLDAEDERRASETILL